MASENVFNDDVFIDANIPMYAAGKVHPLRLPSINVLSRIPSGQLVAVTSTEVHQEILYRDLSLGLPEKAREVSRDFQTLVPRVLPITVDDIALARELTTRYPQLPARDLIHAAVMLNHGVQKIISADRHFALIQGITCVDPRSL